MTDLQQALEKSFAKIYIWENTIYTIFQDMINNDIVCA